jgi:16S rRNA (guanine527-N7)-methyltransferase
MHFPPKRQRFIDVFTAKNTQLNLSAIRSPEDIFVKHISDSLELQRLEKAIGEPFLHPWDEVIDVWTGGGIPLLPLACAYPDVSFTGLDSVRKKTDAVADMAAQLELRNVHVIWARAEEYKNKQYDVMTARAVAFSDKLFKRTYTLVKKWWHFILYKMFSEDEEARLDSYVMQKKMTMVRKHYYKLYDEDIQRVLYIIKK